MRLPLVRKTILILLVCASFSGCWSRRDLRELGIISTLGIDKDSNGYIVSIQILNTETIAKETGLRTPFTVFSATGPTLLQAVRKITLQVPKKLYFSNIRVVVIGESLARNGVNPVIDFLLRDYEMRISLSLVIAKNTTAQKVLSILTPITKVPDRFILDTLGFSRKYWAQSAEIDLDDLANAIQSDGMDAMLPGIIIVGDPDLQQDLTGLGSTATPALLQLDEFGVFNDDRLVGWLTPDENLGTNYIRGQVNRTIESIALPKNQKAALEVQRIHTIMKGRVVKNQAIITIQVDGEGNLEEMESNLDITKPENISYLEKKFASHIQNEMTVTINKALDKLNADIFGFGEVIHRSDPQAWKRLKKQWKPRLKEVMVNTRVSMKIMNIGSITKPLIKKAGGSAP